MNAMNDQSERGARLMAWILGELSGAEAEACAAEVAADPALAAEAERMREFCQLMGRHLERPPVTLPETARRQLLNESSRPSPGIWREFGVTALAASLAVGGGIWMLRTVPPRDITYGTGVAVLSSAPATAAPRVRFSDLDGEDKLERRKDAPVASAAATGPAPAEPMAEQLVAEADAVESKALAERSSDAAQSDWRFKRKRQLWAASTAGGLAGRSAEQDVDLYADASPEAKPSAAPPVLDGRLATRGGVEQSELTKGKGAAVDRFGRDFKEESRFRRGEAPGLAFGTNAPQGSAGESYAVLPENPLADVSREPLSTFSIDVDTASYANVRRFLNRSQAPPPGAVRLEEMVNYFPYEYAGPTDGRPFAVHVETTAAPWNPQYRLAKVALKGREIPAAERPAANLVFLVDVSGSMDDPLKLPLVKQSLHFVVNQLSPRDSVSLVTYAGASGVALPATNGADRAKIAAAIDGLSPGGSTNGAGGLQEAYSQASRNFVRDGINRVILATDGDFNVGITSHGDLQKLIEDKARSGVFLSVLGYGMGNTKDDTMELLADKGNGNYAYIDSLGEARKALSEQFSGTLVTIAKDVKIQIEFNPAKVRSYRLLGYENRMLAKEDFNDDRKDAGEIGAGHTVTAFYEIVPAGVEPPPPAVDPLKYQPAPAAAPVAAAKPAAAAPASDETMTVKLRWKAPDKDVSELMEVPVRDSGTPLSEASPETRWAASVAIFAANLRQSPTIRVPWDDIRRLAQSAKGSDPHGYRGEFLQLIDRAASVSPGPR